MNESDHAIIHRVAVGPYNAALTECYAEIKGINSSSLSTNYIFDSCENLICAINCAINKSNIVS